MKFGAGLPNYCVVLGPLPHLGGKKRPVTATPETSVELKTCPSDARVGLDPQPIFQNSAACPYVHGDLQAAYFLTDENSHSLLALRGLGFAWSRQSWLNVVERIADHSYDTQRQVTPVPIRVRT